LLCLAAFIYIGLVLYQRAQIQSAADMTAETGAAVWSRLQADTGTGRTKLKDFGEKGLYWRLVDTGREEKLKRIEEYAEKILEKGRLIKPESSSVSADIRDYAIYKKLILVVENRYELPFGRFLHMFGASGLFSIKVTSEAVVDDPVELRRNVDFAVDIEKELEDKFPAFKDIREKTGDILSGVKGKIDDFLK
jgi:hypothetical protein